MKTRNAVHGVGKDAAQIQSSKLNNHSQTSSKRSTVMLKSLILSIVAVFFMAAAAFGQNLILQGAATLDGVWHVKGNIDNSDATGTNAFTGTMNLDGTASPQAVGAHATHQLSFANLNALGDQAKNQGAPVTVSTAFVNNSGAAYTVGANTLNFGGTTTLTSGTFDAANASSIVNYTSGSSQAVLASTYGGTLGLSGDGAKSLGGAVSAKDVTHAGGALTIGQDFTVTGTGNLASISVSTAKKLDYRGTGTLTVATVTGNAGTIEQTTGAGGTIAFTNALANGGIIQTGTGILTFNGNLNNTDGTVELTAGGVANFAANITAAGTMTFANTSTVNYTGASPQSLVGTNYGNLNMSGAGAKTAGGNVTINTAFNNGSATTDMGTYTLGGAGTKAQGADGKMQFGGASNGLIFANGTVEYNRTGNQDITGHASNKYATLLLSGSGTKSVLAGGDNKVHTTGGLTVSDITLSVAGTGLLQVEGDMTIGATGIVTNAGTITVGN